MASKRQAQRDLARKVNPLEPHHPAPYDRFTAASFKALARGDATPHQQQSALVWLCNVCCGNNDLSYRPDSHGGDRATAFAEGKRFVGAQVSRLVKVDFVKLGLSDGSPSSATEQGD